MKRQILYLLKFCRWVFTHPFQFISGICLLFAEFREFEYNEENEDEDEDTE